MNFYVLFVVSKSAYCLSLLLQYQYQYADEMPTGPKAMIAPGAAIEGAVAPPVVATPVVPQQLFGSAPSSKRSSGASRSKS